jgi:hypothetical protein
MEEKVTEIQRLKLLTAKKNSGKQKAGVSFRAFTQE